MCRPCLTRGSLGQGLGTLIVSMMWVCPLSTSTALLWLMSSNLTPLAARTWSPTRMPFCSASPPGSTLGKQGGRMGLSPCWNPAPAPHWGSTELLQQGCGGDTQTPHPI
uniref:Uncharacterized protein n=1 Tax=Zonotrichia albicollis TaxID=44394 RepID=A0A8D2QDC9_ZONAL